MSDTEDSEFIDAESYFNDENESTQNTEEEYNEIDIVKNYIDIENKKKLKYFEKYNNIVSFLEKKIHPLFNKDYVDFSSGSFQKNEIDKFKFTMLSFNHLPAQIILSEFFTNSIKPTLNREKSVNHIESLLKLNYQESIFETSPLIFAIMNKRVKNEINEKYPSQYLCKSSDDLLINNKYYVYTLDGQHRLSTIYKYYGMNYSNLNNKLFENKYFDFKFIHINNVEEYKIIYFAINNSLPQKPEDIESSVNININDLVININKHFSDRYKSIYKKTPKKIMIQEYEDNMTKKPEAPCINIEELKKSVKLKELLKKYGTDILFEKIIKLNTEYTRKDVTYFGYKKDYSTRIYDNVKEYGFYLTFHKGNPMKWIDDAF